MKVKRVGMRPATGGMWEPVPFEVRREARA